MILVKLQVLTRTTGITPCPSFEVSIILFPYLQSPRVLSLSMAVSVFDRTGYVVPTFRQFPQFGITGLVIGFLETEKNKYLYNNSYL